MVISQVASAASTTSPKDMVIVKMTSDYDPAINGAVNQLLLENPEATVVAYGSLEYYWTSSFFNVVDYVMVGHGSEKGIKTDKSYLSWSKFGSIVDGLNPINKVNLLNCDSAKIKEFVPKEELGVYFDGSVDAIIGASIISAIKEISKGSSFNLEKVERIITSISDRSIEISSNVEKALNLYWGTAEKAWAFADYVLIALQAAGITPGSIGKTLLKNFYARVGSRIANLIIIAAIAAGANDIWGAASTIVDMLFYIFDYGFIAYLQDNLSFWDYAKIATSLVGFAAMALASATWVVYLNMAIVMAKFIIWSHYLFIDEADSNNIYQG